MRRRHLDDAAEVAIRVLSSKSGVPDPRLTERFFARSAELDWRWRANRLRAASRSADGVAKFGSGSLLTAAAGLLIAGSSSGPVILVAAITLLSFVIATIFVTAFEIRASEYDLAAELVAAALKETA